MDKTRFEKEVMPLYFNSSSYKSFQRSKNLWAFQTVSKGIHKGECSHPLFMRGNLDLARTMARIKKDEFGDAGSLDQSSAAAAFANPTLGNAGATGIFSMLAQQQSAGSLVGGSAPASSSVGGGPPMDTIDMLKKKSKTKHGKSKNKSAELLVHQEKTNGLREAALSRGSMVVACRARGMSMDHNMHTAFFEIPKNPEHGMDLVCSFPTCRNGGIKFLWCKYCDDVIAKRTFKASHLHKDLVDAAIGNGAAVDAPHDSKNNASSDSSREMPPKKRHKKDSVGQADIGAGAANIHEIANEESSDSGSSSENAVEPTGEDAKRLEEMRTKWDALLDERQEMDSKDDISNWLDRVVETSEQFKKVSRRARRNAKAQL
ncbi:MAG: hypothetical protein SGARI_002062 [Bacillariaceae sp.]